MVFRQVIRPDTCPIPPTRSRRSNAPGTARNGTRYHAVLRMVFAGADRSHIADGTEIRTLPAHAVDEAIAFVQKHTLHGADIGPVRRMQRWSPSRCGPQSDHQRDRACRLRPAGRPDPPGDLRRPPGSREPGPPPLRPHSRRSPAWRLVTVDSASQRILEPLSRLPRPAKVHRPRTACGIRVHLRNLRHGTGGRAAEGTRLESV